MRYADPPVEAKHRESARRIRSQLQRQLHDPSEFRSTLMSVPPVDRDPWLDVVFEVDGVSEDGPELPRGCVPYFPCAVDALLRVVEQARVRPTDVFVDIGSGLGRAAALVHLLTGATAIGVEVQPRLVLAARALATRLRVPRVSYIEGDAAELTRNITIGSVFFLYCPFSGDRLVSVLANLEAIARTRTIRVCTVDLPLPPCTWLAREPQTSADLALYASHAQATASLGPQAGSRAC
jgi:SAM-dependent methyltransferase